METRNATTPSFNDLNNAIYGIGTMSSGPTYNTACADGDLITVGAGTVGWSQGITVTKAITIQGAGVGQTILIDNITVVPGQPTSFFVFNTPASANPNIVNVRITGFEFRPGTSNGSGYGCVYALGLSSSFRMDHCQFTNLKSTARAFRCAGKCFGVVDNCDFPNANLIQGIIYADHDGILGPSGQPGAYGDGSWAVPYVPGSKDAMYFEDCTFITAESIYACPALSDGNNGCRIVVRKCTLHNCGAQTHGSGSTGPRGGRVYEFYNNQISFGTIGQPIGGSAGQAQAAFMRSGTGVIFGNTVKGANPNSIWSLENYRSKEAIWPILPGGRADCSNGLSPFDLNDTTDYTGNGYGGGPGGLWASGAALGGSSAQTLVIGNNGAVPAANFWKGARVLNKSKTYTSSPTCPNTRIATGSNGAVLPTTTINVLSVTGFPFSGKIQITTGTGNTIVTYTGTDTTLNRFTGCTGGTGTLATNNNVLVANTYFTFATVSSSSGTTNTLTVGTSPHPNNNQVWAVGDLYEIRRTLYSFDAPGMGICDYLGSRQAPCNYPAPAAYTNWLNQAVEPWYAWGNTNALAVISGGILTGYGADIANNNFNPGDGDTVAGTHFINNTAMPGYTDLAWPHPLLGAVLGKQIQLSGALAFGNVITGTTAQLVLTISNPGDATLTVSSITYPTGYTGAYSGTIAAGASHAVTVTFSPVAVTTYNGTITVNSDKTGGTNTVAVTGNGVAGAANTPTVPKGFTVIRE
jgi:hypothetical protein